MLKLIKYDIKQNYHIYFVEYALYLILCLAIPFLPDSLSSIVTMFMMMFIFAVALFNIGTIIYNYYQSMFGKQAYLTLTLPYNSYELFASKVIAAVLWIIISFLILFIGFFIISFLLGARYMDMEILINSVSIDINVFREFFMSWDFLQAILLLLLTILSFVISGFTLCTIVQTKYTRKNKLLWLIGIVFAWSMLFNYINIIVTNTSWYQELHYAMMGYLGFWLNEGIGTIIWVIALYFVNVYILEHMIEVQ
ncbi:MAG: hypothetical protein MR210_08185 [Erysipelotrichaceae bacterium]|nr:hypothetical protein [Erysipelotrichaceae bacterium]MDY5251178.1 hypothetical protein [Erysipelotrichaceae bacterium]